MRAPPEHDVQKVTKLKGPGDDVGGDKKLVVENGFLIHGFLFAGKKCALCQKVAFRAS